MTLENKNLIFASNKDPRRAVDYFYWAAYEAVAFLLVNGTWIPIRKDCADYRMEDFEYNDAELAR